MTALYAALASLAAQAPALLPDVLEALRDGDEERLARLPLEQFCNSGERTRIARAAAEAKAERIARGEL